MPFTPLDTSDYLDADQLESWLRALADAAPRWVRLSEIGRSRLGRPLLLVTLGDHRADPDNRPTLWVDGGTHATEWTSVMSCCYALSQWVSRLLAGDEALQRDLASHTVCVLPCVSPDGLHATQHGTAPLRSTLRPPRSATVRSGFEAQDLDGDGLVRWMRWAHPAGGWVPMPDHPFGMRPRTVDDPPESAYFLTLEGQFINWDGERWVAAPIQYGLDLNRNYPVDWKPFGMFGSDSGDYPGSEPESAAVLAAVAARPMIAAALTKHTYTGCLLTPPSRPGCPLPASDVALHQRLARDLVPGTDYRVFAVHPEFTYDPANPIIGTWDDTLSATFGILAFTLELWDPYRWAGAPTESPIDMFKDPDPRVILALHEKILSTASWQRWQPHPHPQLGHVELGGPDELRTIRNPPPALLQAELERGFLVTDRLRRALPQVTATLQVEPVGPLRRVSLHLENHGALSTSSLARAEAISTAPAVRAALQLAPGQALHDGPAERTLHHLDGWLRTGFERNPFYPHLPRRGHRTSTAWLVAGEGPITVTWQAGRGGRGEEQAP